MERKIKKVINKSIGGRMGSESGKLCSVSFERGTSIKKMETGNDDVILLERAKIGCDDAVSELKWIAICQSR